MSVSTPLVWSKKANGVEGVVLAHDREQTAAVLFGVLGEVVEVAEGIDDDVQSDEDSSGK